ncbi:MAG: Kae1-associated kinase Bud32 [Candidatus Nezhaarchaeota archaeon]|nr:Kae1-associated kinase Bud32 [Candidatus Nezhaarchaeota archaeon]MCX8141808.1 Kae1-associated kinase Bud32 [Candidatus Nezhaarchaeota archaeon]MDW8050411.1 Kae1-associated kinase Bud32 [Nitrososphaerota archaeon]
MKSIYLGLEGKLIKKGAEAELYLVSFMGIPAVLKKRVSKPYRVKELDEYIRKMRTSHEVTMMFHARKIGVPVPAIYDVDPNEGVIVMEYIPGPTLKDMTLRGEGVASIFKLVGTYVGMMHVNNIVHGDLTAANIIVPEPGKPFFIDFGLAERSGELEAIGTDIHLMLRALESTHYHKVKELFSAFLSGYKEVLGDRIEEVMRKVKEIRRRGRYVEERRAKVY